MSMRKDLGRSRALRPSAESLEGRQLLSATVSGTDTAGDHWTLTLQGKGSLQVIKQDDPATGTAGTLTSPTEISSITVSGTDPKTTILTGTVQAAAGSDGRVFFNTLNEVPNRSDLNAVGLGLEAINMPGFWLGYTGTTMAAAGSPVAQITIPDGVNSLRFGGVDATKFFGTDPTKSPSQDGQNDEFLVNLGLPTAIGTSIVVDKVISNSQAGTTSSTGTPNPATQKSVVFAVNGRINLFQANEIDGNTQNAPTIGSFAGGTIVGSFADLTQGIVGQLGFIRIGGNATNFSAVTDTQLSNFFIGGETNNVSVLSPNGSRNFYFGKGADTTSILTHSIENLYANRGMLNTTITSGRQIGDLQIGGDVANSTVLSGYQSGPQVSTQSGLQALASNVQSNLGSLSGTSLPTLTIPTPTAQANGQITAFIAGNITNSVFAASVNPISQITSPTTQTFGNPQDALLPLGRIIARVEGSIHNDTVTPSQPNTAFYARTVDLKKTVVTPPNVVEPPLPKPATPVKLPGIPRVFPATASTGRTSAGNPSGGSGSTTGSGSGTSGSGSTGGGNSSSGTGTSGGAGTLSTTITKASATPKVSKK